MEDSEFDIINWLSASELYLSLKIAEEVERQLNILLFVGTEMHNSAERTVGGSLMIKNRYNRLNFFSKLHKIYVRLKFGNSNFLQL